MTPRGWGDRGFSLIELFLVIAVMAILLVAAVPRFKNSYASFTLQNSALNLYKLIQFARERATVEQRDLKVVFDIQKSLCFLSDGKQPLGRVLHFSEGVTFSSRDNAVICHADGNCEPGQWNFRNDQGEYQVSIESLGAEATVRER